MLSHPMLHSTFIVLFFICDSDNFCITNISYFDNIFYVREIRCFELALWFFYHVSQMILFLYFGTK